MEVGRVYHVAATVFLTLSTVFDPGVLQHHINGPGNSCRRTGPRRSKVGPMPMPMAQMAIAVMWTAKASARLRRGPCPSVWSQSLGWRPHRRRYREAANPGSVLIVHIGACSGCFGSGTAYPACSTAGQVIQYGAISALEILRTK